MQARARRIRSFVYVLLVGIIASLVGWIEQSFIKKQWLWWTSQRPFVSANIWPYVLSPAAEQALKAGDGFRECAPRQPNADYCPDMVVVPAGTFEMGSPATDTQAYTNEFPQHQVTIAKPFAVAKFELTFDEWDACVAGGGCSGYAPSASGWGRGQQPVISVSWDDAQRYVEWLSKMTGKPYRLLTDSEYEYAARAGTTTEYPWGNNVGRNNANCAGCASTWGNQKTAPVGSFPPNKFGLYDMVGNVWEWVEDCVHDNYQGAPIDGSPRVVSGECGERFIRGGAWNYSAREVRSAVHYINSTDAQYNALGFRVARTLLAF